jgi:Mrp family chromosome partitioning ATPase
MTTKRTGRYGEIPGSTPDGSKPATRAPLPLVTQPMVPIDDAGATHVDRTLPMRPEPAAVLFSKATVVQPAQAKALSPAGPPPEVGLTQHHLPEGEDLDPRLVMVSEPDSERAASFRVLRHHLLELGRPQVIVVSSALHGDGKTTTALNLALALAECGRSKVLLAEAHLRRPQIGAAVKLVPPWCFAEQLAAHRNQPMLPWSLVEIPQLWLHVAAVNPRIEKTQLLDAPAFAIAMERLRLVYDHVVIDAPPVLGSADVNLMADAADAVVIAARARRTTTRQVRKAIDQVGATKVIGTVLCM